MNFCPDCGSLLKNRVEDGKSFQFCNCGFESVLSSKKFSSVIKEKIVSEKPVVTVSEINPFATESHVCKNCGFDKAVLVDSEIGVRETAGCCEFDRPAYICGKCGFKEFI